MSQVKTSFTDLTLILTERCNLRCSYCYVPKQLREMPLSLALQASEWLLSQAPPGRDLSISFFGGEPLLAERNLLAIMASVRGRRGQGLRFMAPTNGTLLDTERLARLQAAGLELALSVDEAGTAAKPVESSGKTLANLGEALPQLRALSPIVRMTVTPANVGELFESVVAIFGAGLHRIMHQPALEQPWPAEALERWRSEHQRLSEWLVERQRARQPIPDLITLEGISHRLSGTPPRPCGAGVSTAALDAAGRLFGCYRSVFDPNADRIVLGDLRSGWMNEPLLATYARLHPASALPEEGTCKRCEARDGCTIFCPAMGHVLLGDLRAVPALACRLLRIQVHVCRDAMERMRRTDQSRRRSVGAHVAAAALALGLSSAAAACDSRTAPGICAPGVCANYGDAGPGLCAADAARVAERGRDLPGPGLCAYRPDATVDRPKPKPEGAPPPGLCAPGLCPAPGLC